MWLTYKHNTNTRKSLSTVINEEANTNINVEIITNQNDTFCTDIHCDV